MKFGQLIEYNMRTFLLKYHIENVVEKHIPDLFLKNQNSVYLWINGPKVYTVFLFYAKLRAFKIY